VTKTPGTHRQPDRATAPFGRRQPISTISARAVTECDEIPDAPADQRLSQRRYVRNRPGGGRRFVFADDAKRPCRTMSDPAA